MKATKKRLDMMRCGVILTLLAGGVVGCRSTFPPLPEPAATRSRRVIKREFAIAAVQFGSKVPTTGKDSANDSAVSLARAIPAALLRELRDVGRFAVYDGGGLRLKGPEKGIETTGKIGLVLNETTADRFVDAYVSGTLTTQTPDQACFNVRLANAFNHEVLYSTNTCVSRPGKSVDRRALRRVAEDISRSIKRVGNGAVKSVFDRKVIVNKGKSSGIMRGMVAFVVATGESVSDPKIHAQVKAGTGFDTNDIITAGSDVVIGELYVSEVYEDYSICNLFRGDYLLPGDTVYFK